MLPALRLQFSEDIGPEPSGFSGGKSIVPLQGGAELRDEHKGQYGGGIGRGTVDHVKVPPEGEITLEMIEAGEDAVFSSVGGQDLGDYFSARELTVSVYRAMHSVRSNSCKPYLVPPQNPPE
jgi:hypothetical protein